MMIINRREKGGEIKMKRKWEQVRKAIDTVIQRGKWRKMLTERQKTEAMGKLRKIIKMGERTAKHIKKMG